MYVQTKRNLIATIASRWAEQYYDSSAQEWWSIRCIGGESMQDVHKQLLALPAEAGEDEIARIIGNRQWTTIRCSQCKQDRPSVVVFFEARDSDERTVQICAECLALGLDLLETSA